MSDTDLAEEWDVERTPHAGPSIMPIPVAIAAAIVAVKRKIKPLPKTETNKFGDYQYASADVFFEHISPLEAEAGLTVLQQQVGWQLRQVGPDNKRRTMLFVDFDFLLCHENGDVWAVPIHRTVHVDPTNGPQSWGMAQTYAHKQFLRCLYSVPTGEPDADALDSGRRTATQRSTRPDSTAHSSERQDYASQGHDRTSQSHVRPDTTMPGSTSRGYAPQGNEPPSSVSSREDQFPTEPPDVSAETEFFAPPPPPPPRDDDIVGRFLAAIGRKQTVEEVNDIWRQFRNGPGRTLSQAESRRAGNGYIHMIERLGLHRQPQAEDNNG